MKNTFEEIGKAIATKLYLINVYKERYENIRELPIYSEMIGMTQTLKILGIDFSIEYDAEAEEWTEIRIEGKTYSAYAS